MAFTNTLPTFVISGYQQLGSPPNTATDFETGVTHLVDKWDHSTGDNPHVFVASGVWFNTGAFATAPQFTLGSSGRNPVRGPGYQNLDVALIRRVPLRAGAAVEFRSEVFNALDTPSLGSPNGVFGTAAFGTITSAGDPRVIQLAVKFHF